MDISPREGKVFVLALVGVGVVACVVVLLRLAGVI